MYNKNVCNKLIFTKYMFVLLYFKVMTISSRDRICSNFRFHPLWIFLLIFTDICQKIELISVIYVTVISETKSVHVLKIAFFGLSLGKNLASMGHT